MTTSGIEPTVFRFVVHLRNFLDGVEVIRFSVRQNYSMYLFLHLLTLVNCVILHVSVLTFVGVLNACVTYRLFIVIPANRVTNSGL